MIRIAEHHEPPSYFDDNRIELCEYPGCGDDITGEGETFTHKGRVWVFCCTECRFEMANEIVKEMKK